MSAIAGICYWDGRPVPESSLSVLAEHSRGAGPDGSSTCHAAPGIALQVHVLHFDRLSSTERQPCVFGPRSALTWDGRLDNREDLLLTLRRDLPAGDVTDAALVSAAYAKWGLDTLPRLIGDWSLAIWDAAERRVILATDYMGNRPLHYLELAGGLAWASHPDALAVCFDRETDPDETYIAGRLTYGVPPGATPFSGVHTLRAGHVLIATEATGVAVRRYWTFEPSRIRYRDPRAYTEQMRVLLTDAVKVRLRASRPVWAHLSGGFDSSALVCLATDLIRLGQVDAPAVRPLSWLISGSPESDERSFIEIVERWCDVTSSRREWERRYPTFSDLLMHRHPNPFFTEQALESAVVEAGDHVVLSGDPGDLVMLKGASHSVSLVEPLHEGHPLQFLRGCLAYAKRRYRSFPLLFARLAWAAYAPGGMKDASTWRRRLAKRARAAGVSARDVANVFGVTPRLLASVRSRGPDHAPIVAAFPVVKRPFVSGLLDIADQAILANVRPGRPGWLTFPYAHRPLVEFMLATPQSAFWDPRMSRAGMKRALQEVLPPALLARTSKGDPTTATTRADLSWRPEHANTLLPDNPVDEWQVVTRGYVQRQALSRSITATLAGTAPERFLLDCLQLEAWLRSVSSRRHVVPRRGEATTTLTLRDRTRQFQTDRLPLAGAAECLSIPQRKEVTTP